MFAVPLAVAIVLGALGLTLALALAKDERHAGTSIGQTLPALRVTNEQGGMLELPASGGVIVLASATCPHCHATIRMLANISAGQPSSRLVVVGIDSLTPLRYLLDSVSWRVPLFRLSRGNVASAWQAHLRVVPKFLWLSDDGKLLDAQIGELSSEEALTWLSRAR